MRPPILFFFTLEELVDELNFHELDPQHLEILNAAVLDEIKSSEEIKNILKARIREVCSKINPHNP